MSTSILRPSIPPLALISSTAIEYAFLNLSPNGASGPVMGCGAPILSVSCASAPADMARESVSTARNLERLDMVPPLPRGLQRSASDAPRTWPRRRWERSPVWPLWEAERVEHCSAESSRECDECIACGGRAGREILEAQHFLTACLP